MRVISGTARGRTLLGPPPGSSTRPTPDRVREALFQILGPIEDVRVLDLYAGTGALGIEALSRGAAHATFVEQDRGVAKVLQDNLARTGLAPRGVLLTLETLGALRGGAVRRQGPFHLVFADPPYEAGVLAPTLEALRGASDAAPAAPAVLAPRAVVVAEHASRNPPPSVEGLTHEDTRRYGDTAISFYRYPEADSA